MFEQYHLVHFEIKKAIEHGFARELVESVEAPAEYEGRDTAFVDSGEGHVSLIREGAYRITGTFDYLLPHISYLNEFAGSDLYLQSFCVMNNTEAYFTRRKDYDSVLFSYTFSGKGNLIYGGKEYDLADGQGFLIDCRRQHEYHSVAEQWGHIDLHFWGAQAETLLRCFEKKHIVCFAYPLRELMPLLNHVLQSYEMISDLRDLYVGNSISDLLCAILKNMEEDGTADIPPVYREMIKFMEWHYSEAISLDLLAQRFHISKYHLSREFRKYTGFPPGEYLSKIRMQHAGILLSQSDLSIEEIALRSGYVNMSNFIGQMRKRTGMTPSELRKKIRSNV